MGIKFKGKTSTGLSSDGDIAERELHINLVDKDLYTSSDNTDVINLTATPHGYFTDTGKASYIPDLLSTDFFQYVLTEDTMISAPINFKDGNEGVIQIDQDGVGGHTLTLDPVYIFGNGDPKILLKSYERMVFNYKVIAGMIVVEYVASYTSLQMSPYDTRITWDTMTGEAAVQSNVTLQYSVDGVSFNALPAGQVQVLSAGSGPYELRGDGATFLKFTRSTTINGSMTVVSRGLVNGTNMFKGMSNLQSIDVTGFDVSKMTNMSHMMDGLSSVATPDTSSWDTSHVTLMSFMMNGMKAMTAPPDMSNWNTASVRKMDYMMKGWFNLLSPPDLSNFNTANVTNMSAMMQDWYNIPTPPDVSNWDVHKVVNFSSMMSGWRHIKTPPDVSKWDTSRAANMSLMMQDWYEVRTPPDLSNWVTDNVTMMVLMMSGWSSIRTPPNLFSFNTSNVNNMAFMMQGWGSLSNIGLIGIEDFDLSHINEYIAPIPPSHSQTSCYHILFHTDLAVSTYDKILENFGAQAGSLRSGARIDFGANQYTIGGAGEAGRLLLTTAGVIINDGGGI